MANKKKLYLCFYMAHDYQTQHGDGLWYWATINKVRRFFNNLITCSLMANKKRYILNSISPMDTRLDRVVAYGMGLTLKKSHYSY